jgi:hypothetical protein
MVITTMRPTAKKWSKTIFKKPLKSPSNNLRRTNRPNPRVSKVNITW